MKYEEEPKNKEKSFNYEDNKNENSAKMNEINKTIRKLLIDEDCNDKQLAKMMGFTQQNISKKFIAGSFYVKDLIKIADIFGRDLKIEFVKKDE
ncbi:hypothetical protein OD350_28890 (plasmid) [Clostridium beijerinckii]|uniref:hypothetical protein n=1 Tax=Clostridium beijerinckii TaxID=1520 RepID=UPI0022273E51|nr:hypothetical protein [Clostridium beijerinckii]UYZ39092.1 hypothetical protein OD350_28890 [Clostridium beijerinckii]